MSTDPSTPSTTPVRMQEDRSEKAHLEGHVVECPWHGWRFDVQTGERPENPEITVACCPVRIEGNQVQVALPENFK